MICDKGASVQPCLENSPLYLSLTLLIQHLTKLQKPIIAKEVCASLSDISGYLQECLIFIKFFEEGQLPGVSQYRAIASKYSEARAKRLKIIKDQKALFVTVHDEKIKSADYQVCYQGVLETVLALLALPSKTEELVPFLNTSFVESLLLLLNNRAVKMTLSSIGVSVDVSFYQDADGKVKFKSILAGLIEVMVETLSRYLKGNSVLAATERAKLNLSYDEVDSFKRDLLDSIHTNDQKKVESFINSLREKSRSFAPWLTQIVTEHEQFLEQIPKLPPQPELVEFNLTNMSTIELEVVCTQLARNVDQAQKYLEVIGSIQKSLQHLDEARLTLKESQALVLEENVGAKYATAKQQVSQRLNDYHQAIATYKQWQQAMSNKSQVLQGTLAATEAIDNGTTIQSVAEIKSYYDTLQTHITNLNNEIMVIKDELKNNAAQLIKLQSQYTILNDDYTQCAKNLIILETEGEQLQAKLEVLTEKVENYKNMVVVLSNCPAGYFPEEVLQETSAKFAAELQELGLNETIDDWLTLREEYLGQQNSWVGSVANWVFSPDQKFVEARVNLLGIYEENWTAQTVQLVEEQRKQETNEELLLSGQTQLENLNGRLAACQKQISVLISKQTILKEECVSKQEALTIAKQEISECLADVIVRECYEKIFEIKNKIQAITTNDYLPLIREELIGLKEQLPIKLRAIPDADRFNKVTAKLTQLLVEQEKIINDLLLVDPRDKLVSQGASYPQTVLQAQVKDQEEIDKMLLNKYPTKSEFSFKDYGWLSCLAGGVVGGILANGIGLASYGLTALALWQVVVPAILLGAIVGGGGHLIIDSLLTQSKKANSSKPCARSQESSSYILFGEKGLKPSYQSANSVDLSYLKQNQTTPINPVLLPPPLPGKGQRNSRRRSGKY